MKMTRPRFRPRAGSGGGGAELRWIDADLVPGRFFEGADVGRRIAPFVIAAVLSFVLVPLADASFGDWRVLAAAALLPVLIASILLVPWPRLPAWTQALVPLGYFAIAGLLREASPHDQGAFYALIAAPVAWFALYGTRTELVVGIAAMGVTMALPAALSGEPYSDPDQYARAGAAMIVAIPLSFAVQALAQAPRRLSTESGAVLDDIQEAFISMDDAGLVTGWNHGAERTFGWRADEALGRPLAALILPARDRERHSERIRRLLETAEGPILGKRVETIGLKRDGEEFPLELTVSAHRLEDGWTFSGLAREISERKRAESALMEAEERFRRAFDDIRVGMAITSNDGRFLRVNRALSEATGYPTAELVGMELAQITHPDDVEQSIEAVREISEGERYGYRTEQRYVHADGHTVWIALNVSPIHDEKGGVIHMISQIEEITERKRAEEELTHQAMHDPLTALPNRVLFADRVRMSSSRRDGGGFSVIYLDLDGFKAINDTLGHHAGDAVLIEASRRLELLLRDGDTLARLGGDEFAILCEGSDESGARLVAERVIEAFARPFMVDGRELKQAASIGVSVNSPNGREGDPEAILRDADDAMYTAKAAGKSRYALSEGWTRANGDGHERLEHELRAAISKGELVVHYQPELDLGSGAVTGAEALVRWEHPEHGLLEPARFLYAAEASGLIAEIDDFVLWQACHQASRWRATLAPDSDFTVSVNLSERRLADGTLPDKIAKAISDSNLPPSSLCLEVAERAILDRRANALATIPDLETLGVRLLIDDFGVAISSFSAIKRLPRLSAIKIDSSFIAGLGRSPEDSAGVAAIIGLAHGLRLMATAESVETPEQAAELRALNCDRALGFHFARPQPPAAFGELL
ncbi:MAG: EAL domain-containing protein, partial [Actinomycetota bacterium]|nr:EAL domain-containing protein [Actinomycetota bacterium]